jgi:hypothetical protein
MQIRLVWEKYMKESKRKISKLRSKLLGLSVRLRGSILVVGIQIGVWKSPLNFPLN